MPIVGKTLDRKRAERHAREAAAVDDALRAKIYVLEGTICTLLEDAQAWRDDKCPNDPPPRAGQLVCAGVASELAKELTERLKVAKAEAKRLGIKPWDEMGIPRERF